MREAALRSPLSHDQIIATLRSFIGSRRTVPLVSEHEPLLDILVHTQDICLPLDIDHPMPTDAAAVALERVTWWSRRFPLGPRLRGVHLVATDAAWEWGAGRRIEGPVRWLLLAASGRTVAHEHLTGHMAVLTRSEQDHARGVGE